MPYGTESECKIAIYKYNRIVVVHLPSVYRSGLLYTTILKAEFPLFFLNSQILAIHTKMDRQMALCACGVCALRSSSWFCRLLSSSST